MTVDSQPSWGEPRSRTVTWYDPHALAGAGKGLAGVDFLRSVAAGELPGAPIAALIGSRIAEIEVGRVVFSCTPDESAYNPIGVVHGGLVCTLLDSAIGCAVHSTLPAGTSYTSTSITVNYLRAVTSGSGELRAEGRVTKPGRRMAFADATVVDGAGRIVATATGSCLVFPQ
jgi:uncharacterized protein (TIGR00369 family)